MQNLDISLNTTWAAFQNSLNQPNQSEIVLTDAPSLSAGRRFLNFVSGQSPAADKVYQLIKDKVKDHIASRWGVNYDASEDYAIDTLTAHLLEENNVKYQDLKTVAAAKRIFDSINANIIEGAVNYPNVDLNLAFDGTVESDAANMLKLFMGANLTFKASSSRILKALFLSKDEGITLNFRKEIQKVLDHCYEQLANNPGINDDQKVFIEAFIGNLLSLIPYTDPKDGEIITVPQKINGTWTKVPYKVDLIHLTPEWLGTPFHALGLIPVDEYTGTASPLLVFYPTIYPTLSGSLMSAISTSFPGHAAGEAVYRYFGKEAVSKWLNDNGSVKAYGLSLGGCMALLAVCDYPRNISEAHIYGSPAPLQRHLKAYARNVDPAKKPNVQVYCNHGDGVVNVGTSYHNDWKVHTLIHPKKQTGLDLLFVHGTINSSYSKAIKLKRDAEIDSKTKSRLLMNVIHQTGAVLFLPITMTVLALSILKSSVVIGAKKLAAKIRPHKITVIEMKLVNND